MQVAEQDFNRHTHNWQRLSRLPHTETGWKIQCSRCGLIAHEIKGRVFKTWAMLQATLNETENA